MKELSIKEKAQRYDEAIERVVNIRTGKCETTFIFTEGLFNYLFPELEECNGEEVRKAMIDFFKHEREEGVVVSHYGVNIERMIAWLEKQGEPADINPSEFDLRLNKLLKQFETLPKEELASSLSFYLNVVQNDGTYREEKQGEVPVTINIDKMVKDYANNEECDNEGFGKPVNCMIRAYRQGLTDAIVILNLRKQGEQNLIMAKSPQLGEWKPAWSKEDEKAINDIMWIIEAYRKDGFNETHIQMADNSEKWLKSLKPQNWKPSEEHIHWLKWAINIMPDTEKANEAKAVLEDLLEQLKKLREE